MLVTMVNHLVVSKMKYLLSLLTFLLIFAIQSECQLLNIQEAAKDGPPNEASSSVAPVASSSSVKPTEETEKEDEYDEDEDLDDELIELEELLRSSETDDEMLDQSKKSKVKRRKFGLKGQLCGNNRSKVKLGGSKRKGSKNKLAGSKRKGSTSGSKKVKLAGNRRKGPHSGHKKVKPVSPCSPQKVGQCVNLTRVHSEREKIACLNVDYCKDDCDCPSYQKCCTNSCGTLECLPAIVDATQPDPSTSSSSSSTPESVSPVEPVASEVPAKPDVPLSDQWIVTQTK